jgi:hypothetical protein
MIYRDDANAVYLFSYFMCQRKSEVYDDILMVWKDKARIISIGVLSAIVQIKLNSFRYV